MERLKASACFASERRCWYCADHSQLTIHRGLISSGLSVAASEYDVWLKSVLRSLDPWPQQMWIP